MCVRTPPGAERPASRRVPAAGFAARAPGSLSRPGIKRPALALPVLLLVLTAGMAAAQSPVRLTLGTNAAGSAIPPNFIGLSFGSKTLLPNDAGGHFFSATNTPLITLFQNLAIQHLRLGGTTVESPPGTPIPKETDIDNLFAFVRAAHVKKVIYSLRLLETNATQHYAAADAAIAKYVREIYEPYLDCFAIGNEPDRRTVFDQDISITNFATYLSKWRQFAAGITSAVPKAAFAGPDAGSGNVYWTTHFAQAERDSGRVKVISEHFYVGGAGRGVSAPAGIEAILSPAWLAANQRLYERMAAPVLAEGLPYRFTEANDHYSGGIPGASDTVAGALWALDFLHWWAAHRTQGVDFHNTHWVANDVIALDATRGLRSNPKGYGLKAFDLGGHGNIEPLTLSNPDRLNVTAYAVRDAGAHLVTIINKEHGAGARAAEVAIEAPGAADRAEVIVLACPDGDAAAKSGVTLGGATIEADAPWRGSWSPLPARQPGQYGVKVAAVSAAVVKIPAP